MVFLLFCGSCCLWVLFVLLLLFHLFLSLFCFIKPTISPSSRQGLAHLIPLPTLSSALSMEALALTRPSPLLDAAKHRLQASALKHEI